MSSSFLSAFIMLATSKPRMMAKMKPPEPTKAMVAERLMTRGVGA